MSELKAYIGPAPDEKGLADYYLKSEVDAVIAELKKERDWLAKDRAQAYNDLEKRAQLNIKQESEIAELKEQVHDYAQGLYVMQARAEMEARHSNHKRCLAMARWCENALLGWMGYKESFSSHQRYIKVMLFTKWHKRWRELAEKFKLNSTAQ